MFSMNLTKNVYKITIFVKKTFFVSYSISHFTLFRHNKNMNSMSYFQMKEDYTKTKYRIFNGSISDYNLFGMKLASFSRIQSKFGPILTSAYFLI